MRRAYLFGVARAGYVLAMAMTMLHERSVYQRPNELRVLCRSGQLRARARHLVVLLVAVMRLLAPSVARAGVTAIDVDPALVRRVSSDGSTPYQCPDRLTANGCIVEGTFQGVGRPDCNDDTLLSFSVGIVGLPDPTGTLQVWAGTTDCTQPGATNNTATATCWPVAQPPTPASTLDLVVRVADIAAFVGAPSPPQTYASAAAATACANPAANAESTLAVYFLWFPNGQTTPSVSSSAYPVKLKLGAPGPCAGVTATPSAESLTVSWLPPPGDATVAGFDVFADPASACGDAAAIDPSHVSVQVVGATSTQASVSGLLSKTSYETAVAAVDEFGNVGNVSPAADCATTGDEVLKGSCGCSAVGAPTGGFGVLALGALLLFFVIKRSRSGNLDA